MLTKTERESIIQELKGYNGNPKLLLAGEKYQYTKWEIEEIVKCKNDIHYFIENYVKIIHVDRGLIPFVPWDFQNRTIDVVKDNRFVICKFPRQSGKSTTIIAYILWYILFNENVKIAILAHRLKTARDLFSKVRTSYEHLPKFLQAGIAPGGWNKGSIILGNGSIVMADATTGGSIRGESFNIVLLDEFAFVDNNLAKEFMESVYPTISSGTTTKIIIVSTPHGMNHYYEMWEAARLGRSEFVPIEVKWNEVPGRDEAWKQKQIKNTNLQSWLQEFECAFLGSSTTLLSADALEYLLANVQEPIKVTDNMNIYEEPKDGYVYALTVDVSRGQGLDYQAFSVTDVTNFPYKQVLTFRDNKMSPTVYPTLIKSIAEKYNYAHILVEISDIGGQVADMLVGDLDTENVIRVRAVPGKGQFIGFGVGGKVYNGLKTSPATKRIGCADLKTLIENHKLLVPDRETVKEFTTFVADTQSFAAEEGKHDDLVMSLVLFGWLSHQRYFRQETQDIRAHLEEENQKYLDSQMTPFGIIDDGTATFYHDYA